MSKAAFHAKTLVNRTGNGGTLILTATWDWSQAISRLGAEIHLLRHQGAPRGGGEHAPWSRSMGRQVKTK